MASPSVSSSSSYVPDYEYVATHPSKLPYHVPYPLSFEVDYDLGAWRRWFSTDWTLSIWISVAYVVLIFAIQFWMRNRPPYKLRGVLTLWNFGLSVFSLYGTVRTWPEMYWILWGGGEDGGGWWGSCCSRRFHNNPSAFGGLLFTLSKSVELGDTLFIVLRKQPLIFLHWYHHVTVLCYTWYTYYTYDATSRWFMVMNYPVHTLMYFYYAMKALRFRLPRTISMVITILQLSQMVLGVVVNVYALYSIRSGKGCNVKEEHISLGLMMYASYFILFVRFFWGTYFHKREEKKKQV